jgi:tetratricopeptide (TPR) repeat protein
MRRITACLTLTAAILCTLVQGPLRAGPEEPAALVRQAVAAARAGNLGEALTLAGRAVGLAPNDVNARMVRGRIYDLKTEYEKAIADYSAVIKQAPQFADAWQSRSEARFKTGKIRESLADFDEFLKLAPDQKPYHWQRSHPELFNRRVTNQPGHDTIRARRKNSRHRHLRPGAASASKSARSRGGFWAAY